jgi:hypothetical protein
VIDLGMPALASLVPISVLTGIAMLVVFRHASDQAEVRRAKNLVIAHLLEFRLFMDEPGLIFKAQRNLVVANLRFMKLMLRPALILALPTAFLLAQLDAFYARAPLRVGQPAIVTAQLKEAGQTLELQASGDFAIETPPVRVVAENQVSWRVRPERAASQLLQFSGGGHTITKSISSGGGVRYLSERRTGSVLGFLVHPTELPFSGAPIEWIEVRYPPAEILGLHWLVWFLVISAITALLLKRRFRASF